MGFAAGVRSHTLGTIEKYDEFGVLAGTFSPLEYVLDLEYTFHNLISLRTGYRFEDEKIGVSYPTIGCGIHFMYQTMLVLLKLGMVKK